VRKPLIVTSGEDGTVRIWNYLEKTQELCVNLGEHISSVAIHPSGFHVLVGGSDKLRVYNLLLDDLRLVKELQIKGCTECRFSHGG